MNRIKWLTYIPVIIWMAVIFCFSAKNAQLSSLQSGHITECIVGMVDNAFKLNLSDESMETLLHSVGKIVRKTAHFSEYLILALLVWIAGFCTWNIKKEICRYAVVVGICGLYSVTDEIHQLFVEGRYCSVLDMLLDTAGAVTGCLIIVGVRKLIAHIARKKREKLTVQ